MAEGAKYLKVVDWVKEGIEDGTLKYGDRLMSEKELSEKFGLSRQTIRHATGELVKQQLVTRVQGSGTYIGAAFQPVRKEQYHNIAVISTFYDSYIFPPTLRGITKVLSREGFSTQISFTDNRPDLEEEVLKGLLEKDNIDGIIMEPSQSAIPNPNIKLYRELQSRHIPILCFNTVYPELTVPYVSLDDVAAGKCACELLLEAGHKRIAGFFKSDDGQGKLRYQGYVEALSNAGHHVHPRNVFWIDTILQQRMETISDYVMERLADCTAVVCYNDEIAMQVINIANAHGIDVPKELSVVGIDDSNLASTCRVPFTSIAHPKEKLGEKAAMNMLEMIKNPNFDGNCLFAPETVIRNSIKRVLM